MGAQSPAGAIRVRASRRWRRPPASPILNRDEVHVWRIPLRVAQDIVTDLAPLLSGEEEARAKQILDEEAGRRFVTSHGALRSILARYLDERPEQIRLVTDARGKPHLTSRADTPTLCFSLSHSGELALCAVTRGRDVGVDIERIRPVSAWREIAARYFSQHEREALCSLSDDRSLDAFFQGWTHKEAYSKALGQGVSQCWTQFSVSLTPGAVTELPSAESDAGAEGRFTLCPLEPGPGYVAAVAARGVGWYLHCWQWSWPKKKVTRGGSWFRQPVS
jgi:4'-phosphopantetheinyl transferase